jgi:hypothetical protein
LAAFSAHVVFDVSLMLTKRIFIFNFNHLEDRLLWLSWYDALVREYVGNLKHWKCMLWWLTILLHNMAFATYILIRRDYKGCNRKHINHPCFMNHLKANANSGDHKSKIEVLLPR